jgi:hypothetical protein
MGSKRRAKIVAQEVKTVHEFDLTITRGGREKKNREDSEFQVPGII